MAIPASIAKLPLPELQKLTVECLKKLKVPLVVLSVR
jgi:hypothetical protein